MFGRWHVLPEPPSMPGRPAGPAMARKVLLTDVDIEFHALGLELGYGLSAKYPTECLAHIRQHCR